MKKFLTYALLVIAGFVLGVLFVYQLTPQIEFGSSNDASTYSNLQGALFKEKAMGGVKPLILAAHQRNIVDPIIAGHIITKGRADSIRAEYERYQDSWLRRKLLTPTGEPLEGYFISKVLLDTIFKRYTDCNGIKLYLAKDYKTAKRVYTFVIMGTHPVANTTTRAFTTQDLADQSDLYFNYVDTCPPCN